MQYHRLASTIWMVPVVSYIIVLTYGWRQCVLKG